MIDASRRLACVFVDCDWGKKNADLSGKYGVRGYPTVVFCDPDGNPVGRLGARDAASVAKQINDVADQYSGKPAARPQEKPAPEPKPAAARPARPTLIFVFDDSPASKSVEASFGDPLVKEVLSRFNLFRGEYRKDSPQSQKFEITRAPTVLILDPGPDKLDGKVLARITGSRSPRELRRDLDEVLAAAAPAKTDEPAAKAPARPAPPEEKLSDDELERKFIQARLGIANEMVKKGKKDKAIETLEDVIKTYPNHVETLVARKMLEDLKK